MPWCDSCGLRGQEVWVTQPVGDRMRNSMLFLHCFPELLATRGVEARGPGKEFQGEPRDTGRPKPSLLVLMARRPLLPSAASVGSASSQKQQPLLPPHPRPGAPLYQWAQASEVPWMCRHPGTRLISPTVSESL